MSAIAPISPLSSSLQNEAPTAAEQQASSFATDFDMFLNLLTTQLRNQDPLNPMDPTEFVSQLTQFSQLEQMVSQTAALDEINARVQTQTAAQSAGFIGKNVVGQSDFVTLKDGAASFIYTVAAPAEKVEVRIFDSNDKLIAQFDAPSEAGRYDKTWDGRDLDGALVADGSYRVEVVGIEDEDSFIAGLAYVSDEVEEVLFANGSATLRLKSGAQIPFEAVESIRNSAG